LGSCPTNIKKTEFYAPRDEVQFGHLVALMLIVEKQCGHSLVVGSFTGAGSSFFNLFIFLITINIAKATIKKLIMVLIKAP